MPGKSNIRWRASDIEKLSTTVKRYDTKLSRVRSANPDIAEYLPDSKNTRRLIKTISTRAEFNREIRSMERLFKKDALQIKEYESGLKITKYEKQEIQIKVNIINLRREMERKNADLSPEKGTLSTIKERNFDPKPFKPHEIKPGKGWKKFVESVEKQAMDKYTREKMEIYKKNYLKAIRNNLGKPGRELAKMIRGMDAKTIYDAFYDDPILRIGFIYDPHEQHVVTDEAMEKWESVIAANIKETVNTLQNDEHSSIVNPSSDIFIGWGKK